jgi:hypothetical protein
MESEKVIQPTTNHVEQPRNSKETDENPEKDELDQNTSNTIPFPTEPETSAEPEEEDPDNNLENYGRGQR